MYRKRVVQDVSGVVKRSRKNFSKARQLSIRVPRSLVNTGFPPSQIISLKYCETFAMNPVTTSLGTSYVFRAGDIFDPNSTGTGHQPLAHDTWANIYTHYEVLSSKAKFILTNRAPQGSVEGQYVVWAKSNEVVTYSVDRDTVLEQPGIKTHLMISNQDSPKVLDVYYSKRQRYGSSNVDNRTVFGSSPSEQHYFLLGCQSLYTTLESPAGDPGAIFVFAEITFTVKVDGLKLFVQS